eukprot:2203214-Rhodomonas_salina.1
MSMRSFVASSATHMNLRSTSPFTYGAAVALEKGNTPSSMILLSLIVRHRHSLALRIVLLIGTGPADLRLAGPRLALLCLAGLRLAGLRLA